MLGAIVGDVFGASYEFRSFKEEDFDLFALPRFFTDDSVLTVATAEALMGDGDYATAYRQWGLRYPSSYGFRFSNWLGDSSMDPYDSFGNGSAMRVSPVGWAFESLEEVLAEAERSAAVTHNHPEGVKGAQATAGAIYLARTGVSREDIRKEVGDRFGYDLHRTVEEIRPGYSFNETCQGSVPEALVAFFDADDFEHSIRLAISLDGDSDTQAAITGSVAEAFWGGVPERLEAEARGVLDEPLLEILDKFTQRYRA